MSLQSDIKALAQEFETGHRNNAKGTRFKPDTTADAGLQSNPTRRNVQQLEAVLANRLKPAAAPVGKLRTPVVFQAPVIANAPLKPVANQTPAQSQEEIDRDFALAMQMEEDPNFRPNF